MEPERDSNIHAIPRQFGYSNVLWIIENYFSSTCKKNWIIRSPEFSVTGRQVTKWRLTLEGKTIREHYTVNTYLERLETDPFPGAIRVKLRFSYPSGEYDQAASEVTGVFERNTRIKREVFSYQLLESHLRSTSCGTFKVRCRMIVYEKNRIRYDISTDLGLKCLSQDMSVLFRLAKSSDVVLFVGCNIFAHKAILSIRNRKLRSEIETHGEKIDYSWLDSKAAENVMAFLYTANLDYVLRTPSLSMHDFINYLNVAELKCYYTEDELTIHTVTGMQEFNFKWVVPNISSDERDRVLSPCWRIESFNTTLQFTLYLKGFDQVSDHFAIFGQFVRGEGPKELHLVCAASTTSGICYEPKCLRWSSEESDRLGFEKFIAKSILEDSRLATNDNLQIIIKLQIPTGTQKQYVANSKTYSLVGTAKYPHLQKLSADLGSLFHTGEYSDFTVSSRILRYKTHKAILRSRSHVLARLLFDIMDENCLSFPDVDAYTLRVVLLYMYTGTFNSDETLENIIKIYNAAEKFCMLPLKYTCSQILRDKIDLQNVLDILALAHKSKDLKLKVSAFKFICLNVEQIQRLESWIAFVDANVSIGREISDYIKKFITVHNRETIAQSGHVKIEDFIKHFKSLNSSD